MSWSGWVAWVIVALGISYYGEKLRRWIEKKEKRQR